MMWLLYLLLWLVQVDSVVDDGFVIVGGIRHRVHEYQRLRRKNERISVSVASCEVLGIPQDASSSSPSSSSTGSVVVAFSFTLQRRLRVQQRTVKYVDVFRRGDGARSSFRIRQQLRMLMMTASEEEFGGRGGGGWLW